MRDKDSQVFDYSAIVLRSSHQSIDCHFDLSSTSFCCSLTITTWLLTNKSLAIKSQSNGLCETSGSPLLSSSNSEDFLCFSKSRALISHTYPFPEHPECALLKAFLSQSLSLSFQLSLAEPPRSVALSRCIAHKRNKL